MTPLTDEQIQENIRKYGSEEKPGWYYCSFADETRFLGGLYMQGTNFVDVLKKSHEQGINPGGEVQFQGPLPTDSFEENVPEDMRNRLLTKEEVESV